VIEGLGTRLTESHVPSTCSQPADLDIDIDQRACSIQVASKFVEFYKNNNFKYFHTNSSDKINACIIIIMTAITELCTSELSVMFLSFINMHKL